MGQDIRKTFCVGEEVYRCWRYPDRKDYWYEGYPVERLTASYVFVRHPFDGNTIRLSRRDLERRGSTIHQTLAAVFYVEMPDEYRKGTIGYLMDQGPRKVLGLPDLFTQEQLREAYRRKARETHPDRGGDAAAFAEVQAAYERLAEGSSIGDILDFIRDNRGEDADPSAPPVP